MTIFHLIYILLGSGAALILLPVIWCRWRDDRQMRTEIVQRLGFSGGKQKPVVAAGKPCIWIHAVSVGEVKAAETVIRAMDRLGIHCSILLTTTTRTGQEYAQRQLVDRATVRYAPLDLWAGVGRFLSENRPDALVCLETEIWPNWLFRAHRFGAKIAIVNGRISGGSFRSYLKIRPLIEPVLKKIDAFSMKTEIDAIRIRELGAPENRVHINGNVKMDALESSRGDMAAKTLRRTYALEKSTPVFIAGSLRGEENAFLVDVACRLFEKIPDLVCILAPRHLEHSRRIAALATTRGVAWQYRTDLDKHEAGRSAPLVILNTIGELRHAYALARVVFIGGSLVPIGGQNILEAAIQGKPVLFGPFMEEFKEEKGLLESWGGGIGVPDKDGLALRALDLLTHPEKADRLGTLARKAILANQGAAMRHARVVQQLFSAS
jgi:3-deoxy-D-manno-octulosonic-acid transferase